MIRLQTLMMLFTLGLLASCGSQRGGASGGGGVPQQRYTYSPDGVPPPPDYSNEGHWAALPHRKDAADTVPGKNQFRDEQDVARADVFFVHPTTLRGATPEGRYRWNADVNDAALNAQTDASTILYQASVFNGGGRIYAPRYRQAHLSVFFSRDTATHFGPLGVAYTDIKNAFRYYLDHYNNGRPFVIGSHSQGTVLARRLVRDVIEADSALYDRFIAAYLVGYAVVQDSFARTGPCRTPQQTQCYCTWNTFATGFYPSWYTDGLHKSEATNPLTWTTDTTYAPNRLNKGGVLQDFSKIVPRIADARVKTGMVWINKPRVTGAALLRVKNYHIGDYNLFYVNIRENVQQRVEAFFERTTNERQHEK